eukprot:gene13594-biopygen6553
MLAQRDGEQRRDQRNSPPQPADDGEEERLAELEAASGISLEIEILKRIPNLWKLTRSSWKSPRILAVGAFRNCDPALGHRVRGGFPPIC